MTRNQDNLKPLWAWNIHRKNKIKRRKNWKKGLASIAITWMDRFPVRINPSWSKIERERERERKSECNEIEM